MKQIKLIILSLFAITVAYANVWVVPDSIATIQVAIDTAQNGDTVLVTGAFQNEGPVEIIGKGISLLSRNYLSHPSTYNIASGTALFDSLSSRTLLKISSADSTVVRGFLLEKTDDGKGGGILVEASNGVVLDGIYFKANALMVDNSRLSLENTVHYDFSDSNAVLLTSAASVVDIRDAIWKNSTLKDLIVTGSGTELTVNNLAVFNNSCMSDMYNLGSSSANFSFFTSTRNTVDGLPWKLTSTYVYIENSILEHSPTVDIAQCEINYSALPIVYPGNGNITDDPQIDTTASLPVLLDFSPCISAANPDTSGILRVDLAGNPRPDPEWAPPDMGAIESPRHVMKNDAHRIWIDQNGDDLWGNGSPDLPMASLSAAADLAIDHDTLIIRSGTYTGLTEINNKTLNISSEFILNGNSAYIDSVILCPDPLASTPVMILRDIDSLFLSGLTLRDGRGYKFYSGYSFGGAIYVQNSDLRINNVCMKSNRAEQSGGAIYALDSDLLLDHVNLTDNAAYFGGAIALSSTKAYFSNVSIGNNTASSGGGIYAQNASIMIGFYMDLLGNKAMSDSLSSAFAKTSSISQYGGAIFADNASLRLYNTLMANNIAKNKGGAVASRSGNVYLVQSTLADNQVLADSSAIIYIKDPSEKAYILNSILWNDQEDEIEAEDVELNASSSLIDGNLTAVLQNGDDNDLAFSNILDSDPLFDAEYGLQASSPAINAGLASFVLGTNYLFNYDDSEYPAPAPHLGYTGASPAVKFGMAAYESSVSDNPESFDLLSAYPNPFNPTTTLRFSLTKPGHAELNLFDIRGRFINNLVDRYFDKGIYSIDLHAGNLPSGVYIVTLLSDRHLIANKKIVLVK